MGGPPPQAYQAWDDWLVAVTGLPLPWRPYPCAIKEKYEFRGEVFDAIASKPTDECVRMLPAQRYVGVWANVFEGSQFCPGAGNDCQFNARPRIWLDAKPSYSPDQKLYKVEFVGRRTMFLGAYGHMGMSDLEIVVDRMISMKEIEPPPRSPAEIKRQWRVCQALGVCISPEELEAMHKGKK